MLQTDPPRAPSDLRGGARDLPRPPARLATYLICSFAIVCSTVFRQFTSNQQTYLARAVATEKFPDALGSDWFVTTTDPVPAFTTLSVHLLRLGDGALTVVNVAIGVLFLVALCALSGAMNRRGRAVALVTPALVGICWLAGGILHRQLFDGLAEQRAYSPYWQPSNAGVLLLAAIWLAFSNSILWAVVVAGVAAWIHPTYVFSALVFDAGVCASIVYIERNYRRAALVALLGFACILPPVIFALTEFSATSAAAAHEAARVLVEERLPHHARFSHWAGWVSLAHCVPVVCACIITSGKRRMMLVAWFTIAATATVVVACLNRAQFELLFPWRCSVWLMPVGAAICLGAVLSSLSNRSSRRAASYLVLTSSLVILSVLGWVSVNRAPPAEDFRGVQLARTIDIEQRREWTALVPVDWEGLRLNAPLAVFVDFKSHPYKDIEVLEWQRRLSRARAVYDGAPQRACEALANLIGAEPRLGYVLAPVTTTLGACPDLRQKKRDDEGVLFEIIGRTAAR